MLSTLIIVLTLYVYAMISDSTEAWVVVSELGGEYTYILLFMLLYVFVDADLAINSLLIVLVAVSINGLLKGFFKIPRPSGGRVIEEGYSFPSRHTSTSSTFWSYLVINVKNSLLTATAIVVVLAVMHSRIALGVHTYVDVCAGTLIGVTTGVLYSLASRRRALGSYYMTLVSGIVTALVTAVTYGDPMMWKVLGLFLPLSLYIHFRRYTQLLATLRPSYKVLCSISGLAAGLLIMVSLPSAGDVLMLVKYSLVGVAVFYVPLLTARNIKRAHSIK